jgi:hypothetical protein
MAVLEHGGQAMPEHCAPKTFDSRLAADTAAVTGHSAGDLLVIAFLRPKPFPKIYQSYVTTHTAQCAAHVSAAGRSNNKVIMATSPQQLSQHTLRFPSRVLLVSDTAPPVQGCLIKGCSNKIIVATSPQHLSQHIVWPVQTYKTAL